MTLSIAHLSHHYGVQPVLHDISFTVDDSELACLVGPSGCGKSTLLRLIAGLEPLQNGIISYGNRLLADSTNHVPPHQRHIGLVFQHPSLFPHLTVAGNICFGMTQLSRAQQRGRCEEMLTLIGLSDRAQAYPHQLSGGQHQRVALARALAPKPHIMLLDEPFANLDHVLRREMREEVMSILKQAGVPIMMVTHDPEEALMMADVMILLGEGGTIQQMGSPDMIHNAPKDLVAARFFSHINEIEGRIEGEMIRSKLGDLEATRYALAIADGTEVVIATRPEGIRIAREGEACVHAMVEHVTHTGAGWMVRAHLPEGGRIRFHHIYGLRPSVGDKVCVTYEPPHIFVFERTRLKEMP